MPNIIIILLSENAFVITIAKNALIETKLFIRILQPSGPLPLLRKHLPAHLQHGLEALASLDSILAEPRNGEFLDAVLDFLPAAAQGNNARVLVEDGAAVGGGAVYDDLVDADQVVEGHILAAHGHLLRRGVDVGGFVDVRYVLAAEDGGKPFGCGLFAGYEAFCTELVCVSELY